MITHRRIILFLFLMTTISTLSAGNTTRLKNYDNWKDIPSKQLMQMGKKFLSLEKIDSALMCYNIVANRYHSGDNLTNTPPLLAGKALYELGVIYSNHFIDYGKASLYLYEAQKIAKESHFMALLSNTYISLSNISLMKNHLADNINVDNHTMQLHHAAFITALEANEDPVTIITSAFNLIRLCDNTVNFRRYHNDFDLFLNYHIPNSLKKYEFTHTFAQAIIEKDRKNFDKCLQLLDSAYSHVYHKNYHIQANLSYSIINTKCRLLIELRRDQEALKSLHLMLNYGQELGDSYKSFVASNSIFQYYKFIRKNSVLAEKYELLYLRYKDETLNRNKMLNADNAEFLFQIDEINAEAQKLVQQQKITRIIAWSIAAITIIILTFLYLLWRKYRQVQKSHQLLYENNMALLAVDDERRQLLINYEAQFKNNTKINTKYQSHQMEEAESKDLLHRILYIMETSKEIYLDTFSLDRLAELVDARSSKYVSQVLNDYYKHSFPTVLNEYRVREACRRINDSQNYGHLTVEGIAQSVGFKSYPNFVNNFKKFTGLTPSVFRKQAKVYS